MVWDVRDYHQRQHTEPYRSTVALVEFARPYVSGRVLDAACGAGANSGYLRGSLGGEWVGLDFDAELLAEAREQVQGVEFVQGDLFRLADTFPSRSFDAVFSIQTLSWLERYEAALEQMLAVLRPGGTLIVTSLFTDSLVDAQIIVKPLSGGEAFYNVYCLDRFAAEAEKHGAALVDVLDFHIDVDIEPPTHRGMGTYTRRLDDGSRAQFSGPVWMPWKFLALRAGG